MKKSMFFLAAILCFSIARAQNRDNKPITVLYIITSDTSVIKTTHFFVANNELAGIDLPSKAEASKSLGLIKEDVVVIVTLKKGVKLLNLSQLLASKKLSSDYGNVRVFIDGEQIQYPDDIISTETGLKNINRSTNRIDITTHSGSRLTKRPGTRH